MNKKINLIPEELNVPRQVVKLTKLINKFCLISVIILIGTSLALISFFVYFYYDLRDINSSNTSLKEKVVSLEQTEQKLILTKDRLSKIRILKTSDSANINYENYKDLVSIISEFPELTLQETEVTTKGLEISISTTNNLALTDFLKKMLELNKYPNVLITSLNFDPKTGSLLTLIYGI